ncbi:MAG TPA: Fic family protein [Bacteroidota bacterium]|nr:Fic family protein [Bacteroidota bacterium]
MTLTQFNAGRFTQQYLYRSFTPSPINIEWIVDSPELSVLLSQADIKLGELNAFSQLIPDVDFFIKMHVLKEGTKSSRIEGTQTNIEEALQKVDNIPPEKKDDWQEVHNYVNAMNYAIDQLATLPISSRLLCQTHRELLQGVRGTHKQPGDFRTSQNWIGGSSLNDAIFIPPHHTEVQDLMGDLEKFIHNSTVHIPHLIKIGIAHYQFETIHPFLDGNGRIGRLLITLYLVGMGLLVKPTLYLSDFFERNRSLYYDNLMRVRTHNDLEHWLKFFLEGVRQTANNSIDTFRMIIALRTDCEHKILGMGKRSMLGKSLLQYLFSNPITTSQDAADALDVTVTTALRLIDEFIRAGILKEVTGFKRNRMFVYDRYLSLFA